MASSIVIFNPVFVLSVSLVNDPVQDISIRKVVKDDLAGGFRNPPDSAKPWVFMWWYGKITPEDITQHMEELKSKGVGGVLLFDHGGMPGVPYAGDAWRVLFRHTVKRGRPAGTENGSKYLCRLAVWRTMGYAGKFKLDGSEFRYGHSWSAEF